MSEEPCEPCEPCWPCEPHEPCGPSAHDIRRTNRKTLNEDDYAWLNVAIKLIKRLRSSFKQTVTLMSLQDDRCLGSCRAWQCVIGFVARRLIQEIWMVHTKNLVLQFNPMKLKRKNTPYHTPQHALKHVSPHYTCLIPPLPRNIIICVTPCHSTCRVISSHDKLSHETRVLTP